MKTKTEKKLEKLQNIIAKVEANYASKKNSVIWTIWNNLYDLEHALKDKIKTEEFRKFYRKLSSHGRYQLSLVQNNID